MLIGSSRRLVPHVDSWKQVAVFLVVQLSQGMQGHQGFKREALAVVALVVVQKKGHEGAKFLSPPEGIELLGNGR